MTHDRILFLGPADSPLIAWLREQGHDVVHTADRLAVQDVLLRGCSFLVSYGYKHILGKSTLENFPDSAINLHISYLPWNRGADPNLWSFLEGTPKGVTIHYLDHGVDTGDIIAQEEIQFDSNRETLATSYEKLHVAIQDLFKRHWPDIRSKRCPRRKQVGEGSTHRVKDKDRLSRLLAAGWRTPVSALEKYGAETRAAKREPGD